MGMGPGQYKIKAVAGAFQIGKSSKGTEQIGVTVECVGGDGADKNRQFTWFGFCNTADNIKRTLESCKTLGWDGGSVLEMKGLGSVEAIGSFDEEEYEGKTSLRLNWINAAGGVQMRDKLVGGELQSFAARMQAAAASLGMVPSTGAAPAVPPSQPGADAPRKAAPF